MFDVVQAVLEEMRILKKEDPECWIKSFSLRLLNSPEKVA